MASPPISRRAALWRLSLMGTGGLICASLGGAMRAADLVTGETDHVATIINGQTFELRSGLRVRLAGIAAPQWDAPWGREARDGLQDLIAGQQVQLSYGGDMRDRYERALAQVRTLTPQGQPGLWIQQEMVRRGLARVYTWPDEQIDATALYAAERVARAQGMGLWSDPAYAIRTPDPNNLAQDVDSLQIVEGIVTSTADIRGRAYLNFGADYRTDFTVAVAKKHRKRFKDYDPVSLEGAHIRVRGWIELYNGPMIWASHPARLEVLS